MAGTSGRGGADIRSTFLLTYQIMRGMSHEAFKFLQLLQEALIADDALTIYSLLQPIAMLSDSSFDTSFLDALFPQIAATSKSLVLESVSMNSELFLRQMLFWPPQNQLMKLSGNYTDYYTPFLYAVHHGRISTVQVFLEHFNVDGLIEQTTIVKIPEGPMTEPSYIVTGVTPLWLAVYREHFHIVRMLLDYGADINARTSTGSTPLRVACFNCDQDMVGELLRRGADPNSVNIYGNSCLMLAANVNDLNVVAKLLRDGSGSEITDVNQKARCGSTALHFHLEAIVRPGRVYETQIMELLLKEGATYSINYLGMTPLMYGGMSLALFSMYDPILKICVQAEVANAWDLACCELISKGGSSPGWHLSEIQPPGSWTKYKMGHFMKMAFEEREKWNGQRPIVATNDRRVSVPEGLEEVRSFEEMEQLFGDSPVNIAKRLIQRLLTRERILGADNPELNEDRRSVAACTRVFKHAIAGNILIGIDLDAVGGLRQAGFLDLAANMMTPLTVAFAGDHFRDGFSHGLVRRIMSTLRGFFQESHLRDVFLTQPYRGQVDAVVVQLFRTLLFVYTSKNENVAADRHQLIREFRHFTCLPTVDRCMVVDPLNRALTSARPSIPCLRTAHEVFTNGLVDLQVSLNRADPSSGATPLHHLMSTIHKCKDSEDVELRMRFLKRMLEKGAHPDVVCAYGTPGQYCDSGSDCLNCAPARRLLRQHVTLECLASRALISMMLNSHRGVNLDIPAHLGECVKWHGPFITSNK